MKHAVTFVLCLVAALPACAQDDSDYPDPPKPKQELPDQEDPAELEPVEPRREEGPADLSLVRERPTSTWNPYTVGDGLIVVEAGGEFSSLADGGAEQFALPTLARYGLTRAFEFFAMMNTLVDRSDGGGDSVGIGDLSVGLKWSIFHDSGAFPSVGGIVFWKLPTADRDVGGSGEGDLHFVSSFGKKLLENFTGHANIGLSFVSDDEDSNKFLFRTVISLEGRLWLNEIMLSGELAHLSSIQPMEGVNAFARVGASYLITKDISVDGSVRFGLSSDADEFAISIGVSFGLGRFW
jgi:hypothetical protein